MATVSFGDAMAGFSDVLYARAMERMSDKRNLMLGAPVARANSREKVAFDVTLEKAGLANISVKRYCAGFALHCTAWIKSPDARVVLAGHFHSSDGGGTEFENIRPEQPVRFELKTNMWRSTMFSVSLRTSPALPEGTVLQVCMDIDY